MTILHDTFPQRILQPFNDKFCYPPPKIYPGLNEVKILGPKNHSHEFIVPHYQDTRFLSPYEQFLKNATMQNTCVSDVIDPASEGCRKEVKILGKKLGTGIITTTEEGDIVKIIDDKSKFVSNLSSFLITFQIILNHQLVKHSPTMVETNG